jgi:hypothetical protein
VPGPIGTDDRGTLRRGGTNLGIRYNPSGINIEDVPGENRRGVSRHHGRRGQEDHGGNDRSKYFHTAATPDRAGA